MTLAHQTGIVWHRVEGLPPLSPEVVHVWQAGMDRDSVQSDILEELLSPEERARAARFHFDNHRQRYIVGRGLLRRLLASYLPCRPQDVRLCYNSHGKPALSGTNCPQGLKFNASHSDGLLLAAVALGREIGVDVERRRQLNDWRGLAGRFFAPREVAALDGLPSGDRERAFFTCWTRKEAYLKAQGLGLALPLNGFAVSVAPDRRAGLLAADHDPAQLGRWELRDVSPDTDYAGAVAVEGGGWELWCGFCPW